MKIHLKTQVSARSAFSLIEVVLAIGIFLVTVMALVGLLGPTLKSVDEVEQTDEVTSVVNTVNAFLHNSPDIALTPNGSAFNAIFNAVAGGNSATIFVFKSYRNASSEDVELTVGFNSAEDGIVGPNAIVDDFTQVSGTVFRVVLTPSSVLPTQYRSADRGALTADNAKTYALQGDGTTLSTYLEGYFAMEVRIYAEPAPAPGGVAFESDRTLIDLATNEEPIFTYNTAVVR